MAKIYRDIDEPIELEVLKQNAQLGNVPNVTTNNQTPTWSMAKSLSNIVSGETLTVIMGKISKAINDIISHIGNKNNPHSVTKSQIGLGNVENKSGATIRGEMTKSEVVDALGYTPPTSDTNTTYTLTKSGSTITLTGSDGSKTNVSDSNTTYTLSSFGITATASELNKLDGCTATVTELNYLDGVTSSIQTQLNGKLSTSGTAAKATADASGQNIADTYIKGLSVNGRTITYTKGDGGTGTITTQDTNTTYDVMDGATSSASGSSGLVPAPAAGKQSSFLRGDGTWVVPTNTTYSQATSSTLGLVKIGYTENGKNYPVELSNGQMFVNVPWTDTNTTYSQATSTTAGLVKIGFTESGKNYPVELNTSGQMFVNVPWTDTNTTYGLASTTANGLLKQLSGNTSQFMRGDGTWATPPNTTYGVATSSTLGLVKSGGDITIGTDGLMTVKDDSHNHTVANIDGLQTQLDNKLSSSSLINPSNINDGYTIKSFYLNTHPENSGAIIPFINNDLAFMLKRGGSAKVYYDNELQSTDISAVFNGSPSYWAINPTGVTNIIIELTLYKTFTWTNQIYVDFGASGWRAKNIKIEVMNSNVADDTWVVKGRNTNNSLGNYKITMSHLNGTGFNKIRFTFSNFNNATIFRIACLGVINYGSAGLRETFVPKDGGEIYGGLVPYTDNSIDLGSSSKKFRTLYGKSTSASSADSATKLQTARKIAGVSFDGTADISISYNNLTDKPTIPSGVQVIDNLTSSSTTASLSANQGRVLKSYLDKKVVVSESRPSGQQVGDVWYEII